MNAREAWFVKLRGNPKPMNGRTYSLFRLESHRGIWHETTTGRSGSSFWPLPGAIQLRASLSFRLLTLTNTYYFH